MAGGIQRPHMQRKASKGLAGGPRLAFLFLALALPQSTGHQEGPTHINQGSGAQRAFNPEQQSLLAALASRGVGSGSNSGRAAGNGGEQEAPPLQKTITGWLRTGPDAGSEPPANNSTDAATGAAAAGGGDTEQVAALRAALPAGVSEKEIAVLLKQEP